MKEFIISYIEDNEIGDHKKEILVVSEDFQSCYEEHIQKYPTMVGIVQQFDEEHKTINFLRPNNIQIEKVTDEIFEEEEKKEKFMMGDIYPQIADWSVDHFVNPGVQSKKRDFCT